MPRPEPMPTPKRRIPVGRLLYRFLTGLHMDGRQRRNYRTGHVLPQYRDYYWNRFSRPRRASWRLGITSLLFLVAYGLHYDRGVTLYWMAASVPFLVACIIYKLVDKITVRSTAHSSDGVSETYRALRPRYYRRWRRFLDQIRFKLRPPTDGPIPPDWERPIKAQLAEDGIPPVQTLRRPIQTLDLDELLRQQGPQTGRGRTHKRNAKRRLPK